MKDMNELIFETSNELIIIIIIIFAKFFFHDKIKQRNSIIKLIKT